MNHQYFLFCLSFAAATVVNPTSRNPDSAQEMCGRFWDRVEYKLEVKVNKNMAYEPRISVRVSEELKRRLAKAAKQTHVDESVLVRAALSGLVDYVEKHGQVTFPLRLTISGTNPK